MRAWTPSSPRPLLGYPDPSRLRAAAAAGRDTPVDDRDDLFGPAATPGGALGRDACSLCASRPSTRVDNKSGRCRSCRRSRTPARSGHIFPRESSRPGITPRRWPVAIFDGSPTPCNCSAWRCHTHRLPRRRPGPRTWAFVIWAPRRARLLPRLLRCGHFSAAAQTVRMNRIGAAVYIYASSTVGFSRHRHYCPIQPAA